MMTSENKFQKGDVARINSKFIELPEDTTPKVGDEVSVTRTWDELIYFMMYGKEWVALETQADLVTDPETIGLVKYGEDYCAAYGDGFKDGGKTQADEIAVLKARVAALEGERDTLKAENEFLAEDRDTWKKAYDELYACHEVDNA